MKRLKKLKLGLFVLALFVSMFFASTQVSFADFDDDFFDVRYEVVNATNEDVSRADGISQDEVFEFSEGDQILRIAIYNPDSDTPDATQYFYPLAESEDGLVRFVLGSSGLGGGIENMDVNLSSPNQLLYRGDIYSVGSSPDDSCNNDEGCGVNIAATSGARQFLADNYGADPDEIDVDDRTPDEIADGITNPSDEDGDGESGPTDAEQCQADGGVWNEDDELCLPYQSQTNDCQEVTVESGNCGIIRYLVIFINVLSAVAGIVIVGAIIIGGMQYSAARSDPSMVSAAKARIRNAIIALLFFLFGYGLLGYLIPGGLL